MVDLAGQRHYEIEARYLTNVSLLDGTTTPKSLLVWDSGGYAKNVDWGYADIATCSPELYAETHWSVDARPYNPYRKGAIAAYSQGGNLGDMFDLSWIVDENGIPVRLDEVLPDGIRYIKLQNVVDVLVNGSFGSVSPELGTITRVNPANVKTQAVGVTAAPSVLTINGFTFEDFTNKREAGRNVTYYELDLRGYGSMVDVHVEGAEDDNIYVNMEPYYGGTANYTGLLASDEDIERGALSVSETSSRTVRVVIQNGEQEPLIYVVKCTNGGDPAVNAALHSITMSPGGVRLAPDSKGNYIGTVANEVTHIALNVKAINPKSEVTLAGSAIGGNVPMEYDIYSGSIPINVGLNSFKVTIKSEDGSNIIEYTAVIMREPESGIPDIITDGNSGGSDSIIPGNVTDSSVIFGDTATATLEGMSAGEANRIEVKVNNNAALGEIKSEVWETLENGNKKALLEGNDGVPIVSLVKTTTTEGDTVIVPVTNTEAVLKSMTDEDKAAYASNPDDLVGLPVMDFPDAEEEGGASCATYEDVLASFEGTPVEDIVILKLQRDGITVKLERAEFPADMSAGKFIITGKDNPQFAIAPDRPLGGDELLTVAIQDGSPMDWDDDEREVSDPLSIAKVKDSSNPNRNPSSTSTSSGGGCDAGFGLGAVAFALAVRLRKKRK